MRFKPPLRRLDSPTFVFIAASYTTAGGDGVSVGQAPVGATIGAFAYQLVRGEHPTSRGDRKDTHAVDGRASVEAALTNAPPMTRVPVRVPPRRKRALTQAARSLPLLRPSGIATGAWLTSGLDDQQQPERPTSGLLVCPANAAVMARCAGLDLGQPAAAFSALSPSTTGRRLETARPGRARR
jgi:hypothetical protein